MKKTIVWFRQDLRVEDHPPLFKAMSEGDVIPLFIWAPEEEGEWPQGGASKWWLHHSLKSLENELETLGMKLIIKSGPSLSVLKALMTETGANAIYWSRRYEPAAIKRDTLIKSEIKSAKSFKSNLLFEPWELTKKYKVFTPFYKFCLSLPEPEKPLPKPEKKTGQDFKIKSEGIDSLGLLPRIHWEEGIDKMWDPGAPNALKILKSFEVSAYSNLRDRPDIKGVSNLSPYMHFGEISPRQIWHALLDKEGHEAFLRQIIWREFAHHLLYEYPKTPTEPLKSEWSSYKWVGTDEDLKKWQKGLTGYPIVDAGMRELWTTGWMHNRVRMIVGSFLVKDLQISWVEGAKWFWDTLVDADLANNTFGWQWVAGTGADAAPYFRIFNPTLQGQKFDPNGDYVKKWIPELRGVSGVKVHTPWELGGVKGYPERVIDHDVARKRALRYKENYDK